MKNNAIGERLCLKTEPVTYTGYSKSKSIQETRMQIRRQIGGCRIRNTEELVVQEQQPQMNRRSILKLHLLFRYFCFKILPVMENRAPSFFALWWKSTNKLLFSNFPLGLPCISGKWRLTKKKRVHKKKGDDQKKGKKKKRVWKKGHWPKKKKKR